MKPKTVPELFDYLEAHPWLHQTTGAGGTFRAQVNRKNWLVWEGNSLTFISFSEGVGMKFDERGFETTAFGNTHRFEYADEPSP